MSTLTKTGAAAGIASDPQVSNPANNLPEVDVIDASTTKSDAKSAGTQAQTENAENAEMNKAKTLQALRQHFAEFKPAGVEFDEKSTRAGLKAAGLKDDVINATIKALAKKAAETVTVDEFINHINTDQALKNDVLNYCGNACLDPKNLVLGDSVIIYHSSDDNGAGYIEQNICDGVRYYEEHATITVQNLIKSVASYSIKRNTVGKSVNIKSDAKLSLNTFDNIFDGIVRLGTASGPELLGRVALRVAQSGLYNGAEISAVIAPALACVTFNDVERL